MLASVDPQPPEPQRLPQPKPSSRLDVVVFAEVTWGRRCADAIPRQYTYGNYLDEVWTLDNRSGGITVADLNDGTGNDRHFYHCNTLYSVYGITDEAANLVEAYQYDAYGKQTVITDGNDGDSIVNFSGNDTRTIGGNSLISNPYMWQGQRFDPETGLGYWKLRFYSYDLGRFTNRNPWGYIQDRYGLYDLARSCPTFFTEPMSGGGDPQKDLDPGPKPPFPPSPEDDEPTRAKKIKAHNEWKKKYADAIAAGWTPPVPAAAAGPNKPCDCWYLEVIGDGTKIVAGRACLKAACIGVAACAGWQYGKCEVRVALEDYPWPELDWGIPVSAGTAAGAAKKDWYWKTNPTAGTAAAFGGQKVRRPEAKRTQKSGDECGEWVPYTRPTPNKEKYNMWLQIDCPGEQEEKCDQKQVTIAPTK